MRSAVLIAVMAAVTMLLRFLPFIIFRKRTPEYVSYLGRVLPLAIMGMLVVYCLRDINPAVWPSGIPEIISVAFVAGVQLWKRNTLLSILAGTVLYMVLVQTVFI